MLPNLLLGAVLWGGIFSLLGLVRGDVVNYAMAGVVLGLLQGVQWRWQARRADSYRSKHDPPGPTLKLESLPAAGPSPAVSRHGAPVWATVILLLLFALTIPFVIMGALTQEPAWMWLVVWVVIALPLGALLWTILYTYTEVRPEGILLRRPMRSQTIKWSELAEVGWLRSAAADTVVLSTLDGRQVKAVGIEVDPMGRGRQRMLRMVTEIERAWAASR